MSQKNRFCRKEEIRAALRRRGDVFFVGIGGIQMHALALCLRDRGYPVCGSDRTESAITARLREHGIPVAIGHRASDLPGDVSALIYTLAVPWDTPELCAARARGIPCFSRADLLGYLMDAYPVRVAVAGMHGKSTVTAMLNTLTAAAGLDPTTLSGASLGAEGAVYRPGGADLFLCEACEYMDSFLCLRPGVAVALNMDREHTDYFKSEAQMRHSFFRFLSRAQTVVIPYGDPAFAPLLPRLRARGARVLTFGTDPGADLSAWHIAYKDGCAAFDAVFDGRLIGHFSLSVLGEHNLRNALAALCAYAALPAAPLAVPAAAAEALSAFRGCDRRLSDAGTGKGVRYYVDYAHHPTEIRASLAALRRVCPPHARLFCVFQPHTYSRTYDLYREFIGAFSGCDRLFLLDIYAAREKNESGVTAAALAADIPGAVYLSDIEKLPARLSAEARPGDLVVIMGAGDIDRRFAALHAALGLASTEEEQGGN